MCGIIGIFHHEQAKQQVETALAILKNRGKDASKILELKEGVIGHTLHAVVNHVPQPLQEGGILTANCEIYNWKELSQKYNLNAQNDAELVLKFLDQNHHIEELDGVFAFAYIKDDIVILARDLFGVKPLWFIHNRDQFAFASEKKVLEKLGYIDIQELNPRSILSYNIETKEISFKNRTFVTYFPEHQESYEELKQQTETLLSEAIEKRIPNQKFGLLFSGGIDSTFLAKHFKDNNYDFTCYTAVLDTENKDPSDLVAAQAVAKELGLKLKIKKVTIEEIKPYLEKIVPLIEDSNVVKVGVALTFYLACELAKEDGCKVIFSGLGSEEIFAGYDRHKKSANINQECVSGLLKMYERDLYRDDVITMDQNMELRLPFLDRNLAKFSLKIPEEHKIKEETAKFILRDIAQSKGISKEFAFRKKTAAQYGSKFDFALGKLAKQEQKSKSEYLKQFYPSHNVKLGVLFSSGKDSCYSAHIMKRQNYDLTCLITMKSKNPDSYMFQTASVNMVELQAEAMNLSLIEQETEGEKETELQDLELALQNAKDTYKIEGVVSGAVFSTYQRDRIEKICDKLGLKIFSPLWHKDPAQEMKELLQQKFTFVLSAVAADGFDDSWLNQIVTEDTLHKLNNIKGIMVNGEGGEFESLVLDCPLFNKKIELLDTEIVMDSSCSGRLIIHKAKLTDK
ncbi:diphthine--ammonia ligase [Candidatus Woesearchaeota archaeon]|jgi:diphthine-ammonia ligase|nr:diphthine--ammonia ligase [Candidatus Woesearchaeota archaeon]MBT4151129.1 diphthine--ammonia ligase [Candidatus Woesearchaeota archaeon]MBT4247947.1 diphthine--ammonia ligase [Candidatus Woesearchaeota archaeon]MBT4433914.1 diphthine--ammonia ligase [Candidatus Woesearchaeota archaeon]MBT7332019.1 diphthine--ammonia ligase [Candidatus Woesearchaeota archaeon]